MVSPFSLLPSPFSLLPLLSCSSFPPVAGEWPSLPDVGSLSQSLQSLAVASGSSFSEAPLVPCMLGGSSFSALVVVGTACFFASQLSSPAPVQSDPSRSAAPVPSQQRSPLLFALAGGFLCGGFAAKGVITRSRQTFLREAIPLRTKRSVLRS